eukprot:SAG11_NODE_7294_length_1165_cov_1.299250_2_plen_59_part_00
MKRTIMSTETIKLGHLYRTPIKVTEHACFTGVLELNYEDLGNCIEKLVARVLEGFDGA